MLVLAIANGALRDLVYKKWLGELRAHQLSTLILLAFFTLYIRIVLNKIPLHSGKEALLLGLFWLALTLFFEFGFGRYRGNSWEKLLDDYDLRKGRVWIFIPIWVAVGPYLIYRLFNYDSA